MPRLSLIAIVLLISPALLLVGCKNEKTKPDYNRPLPPGASALRLLLDPTQWPDLHEPYERKDADLLAALKLSSKWYAAPSSKQFFPLYDVSHIRAQASVYAMMQMLNQAQSASEFDQLIRDQFNCYTSVGFDDRGTVLYTGYFTPIFKGSRTKTTDYSYPLYKKPQDLAVDPISGKVHGRVMPGGSHSPYPSRNELESSGELNGKEFVYLPTRLDQYIIQVNGSAKIELIEGGTMFVGFAGTNGHEYTGLGATLIEEGVLAPEELNLAAIRRHFAGNDAELERYINMNDRYVFFTEYDGSTWPAGSLGVKVTAKRTLATDNAIFPRGAAIIVTTNVPRQSGEGSEPFNQWMVDQDTGGAIRAAGRGDIYMGIGPDAEIMAGGQFAEGRLYYFFLKHAHVMDWAKKMWEDTGDPKVIAW